MNILAAVRSTRIISNLTKRWLKADVNDEPGTSGNSQQRNANPHPNLGLKSVFVYIVLIPQ